MEKCVYFLKKDYQFQKNFAAKQNFHNFFLIWRTEKWGEKKRADSSIFWLAVQMPTVPGAGPVGSQELLRDFPCGWQGPRFLSHHLLPAGTSWQKAGIGSKAQTRHSHVGDERAKQWLSCHAVCSPSLHLLKFPHILPKLLISSLKEIDVVEVVTTEAVILLVRLWGLLVDSCLPVSHQLGLRLVWIIKRLTQEWKQRMD